MLVRSSCRNDPGAWLRPPAARSRRTRSSSGPERGCAVGALEPCRGRGQPGRGESQRGTLGGIDDQPVHGLPVPGAREPVVHRLPCCLRGEVPPVLRRPLRADVHAQLLCGTLAPFGREVGEGTNFLLASGFKGGLRAELDYRRGRPLSYAGAKSHRGRGQCFIRRDLPYLATTQIGGSATRRSSPASSSTKTTGSTSRTNAPRKCCSTPRSAPTR